jgi:hypothetical protein
MPGPGGESVSAESVLRDPIDRARDDFQRAQQRDRRCAEYDPHNAEFHRRVPKDCGLAQVLIDRARAAVGAIDAIFDDIRELGQLPVASATLPQTRQLEQTILSRDPGQIAAVAGDYTAVYSSVPALNDASFQLEAAEQIIAEIRAAAPGSAPIIEAGAGGLIIGYGGQTQSKARFITFD